MSPKERVLAALARKKTDRAPSDYQALDDVTDRLLERLGLQEEEELLQFLQVDMRRVSFS